MSENRFRLDEFELYQSARAFRKTVDGVIRQVPADEKYALDPQMRRAAISVTNNIAEGHGRWQYQENTRFVGSHEGRSMKSSTTSTFVLMRVTERARLSKHSRMRPTN